MKKELWIRVCNSEETKDAQKFILSLGEEGLLGEIPVKLFFYSTKAIKTLSHIYDVSEKALIPLYEKYGEMNVKIHEYEEDPEEYEKSRCVDENWHTRIAEALEAINSNLADVAEMLESINHNLSNCISHVGDNSFLCVTGNVSTY